MLVYFFFIDNVGNGGIFLRYSFFVINNEFIDYKKEKILMRKC